jgi:hypothetical protein
LCSRALFLTNTLVKISFGVTPRRRLLHKSSLTWIGSNSKPTFGTRAHTIRLSNV